MLEYDRIDLSEGIDANQTGNGSKESGLCGFWFFVDQNFKYQNHLCNRCHDMSMKAISMKNLAIICSGGDVLILLLWI